MIDITKLSYKRFQGVLYTARIEIREGVFLSIGYNATDYDRVKPDLSNFVGISGAVVLCARGIESQVEFKERYPCNSQEDVDKLHNVALRTEIKSIIEVFDRSGSEPKDWHPRFVTAGGYDEEKKLRYVRATWSKDKFRVIQHG